MKMKGVDGKANSALKRKGVYVLFKENTTQVQEFWDRGSEHNK
jgi:hypothetical protein